MTLVQLNHTKHPATPLYPDLLGRAEALTKVSTPNIYSELLHDLAKAGFDGIQTEQLLSTISKNLGCSSKIVRTEFKRIKDQLFEANDIGLLAARLTLKEHYADGLLLKRTPDGCYYFFDKTHWRLTSQDVVKANALKTASLIQSKTNKCLSALASDAMACLNSLLATDDDLLDMAAIPLPVINCTNSELWLDKTNASVEPRPHSPSSRLFAVLDYPYEPQATCPTFDKALLDIFANAKDPKGMVRHLEEVMGYAIGTQRNIAAVFLMIGLGRNGKSKILETIQKLIGEQAILSDSVATFQKDRFNMAALQGKLLFCDDDMKTGITLNDEMIKKLSEAKLMSARHPYGRKKFTFRQNALAILSSNSYPSVDDITPGMLRRIKIIPFARQFTPEEDDKGLFPKIWETEMSGILNKSIAGLQRLLKRGDFLEPEDCIQAGEEFFAHAHPLYAFFKEYTIPAPEAEIKIKDFREAFGYWAKTQEIPIKIQPKKFARMLRGLENEFDFKVTDPTDMGKTAYPKIYGRALIQEKIAEG